VEVLEGVPSYLWYHGCGPTAAGMIIGYWDARGYANLVDGSNDWDTNQQGVKDMIASPGHIADYTGTPDRSETSQELHPDDCVADFMYASRSLYGLADGQSNFKWQDDGMKAYAAHRGYGQASSDYVYYSSLWDVLVAEIDAGRPVELYVDSGDDGGADHFVTAFGYDSGDAGSPRRYVCYNTYDHAAHWYEFAPVGPGQPWGVRAGTWFDPGPLPGDADRDGDVDAFDIQRVLACNAYGNGAGWGWEAGDFNGDTYVDWGDIQMVLDHGLYGQGTEEALLALPEPTTMALLGLAAWAALLRRRP
jgi:hypothetical protein